MSAHTYGAMRKVSARDFAYAELKEQIVIGTLKPDTTLVEDRLARDLEISRTPLRDALHRLEMEELVVRQNNGRLKVAPISINEVEEIYTIRSKLEGIVVKQATAFATEEDIFHLSTITRMIKESLEEGLRENVIYYGSQFHSYIYDMSQNKTAVAILSQLNDHIHRYRQFIPMTNEARLQESQAEHQAILDEIIAQNAQGAKTAVQKHIEESLEAVKHAIKHIQEQEKKGK